MRRTLLILAALAAAVPSVPAFSQNQQDQQADAERRSAERRRREREWSEAQLPVLGSNAAGPCPFVKVLYDAARTIEFADNRVAASNVGFTGEMEGVTSRCFYEGDDPIELSLMLTFSAGRGPQAKASSKDFNYWVAVTTRNTDIIAKERFSIRVNFPQGQDRVLVSDVVEGIVIPRANGRVSGAQFEVLVGFDVEPTQAEFNRSGNRFRVDAGAVAAAGTAAGQ